MGVSRVGGLVGENDQGTVSDSYAIVDVSQYQYAVGSEMGGLVGRNSGGKVSGSYMVGTVTGNFRVGGLVGYNQYEAIVENSYAAVTVSGDNQVNQLVGQNVSGMLIGIYARSQEQMKQRSELDLFDFIHTWAILDGVSYPYFKHSGRIAMTAPDPGAAYRYPANGGEVDIQGRVDGDRMLTLRYVLADGSNNKLREGVLGPVSGGDSFTFTANFGPLNPGEYSLWLWGTYGATGTEGTKIRLQVVPAAPAGLHVTEEEQAVRLTWSPVTGAVKYKVYQRKGDAAPGPGDWEAAEVSEVHATTHAFTGLGYGRYWFTVSGVTADGTEGERAPAVSARPKVPVASVETLGDIPVKTGTPLNQAGLPDKVQVQLADGTMLTLSVNWDGGSPAYHEHKPGTYTFTGTLLPADSAVINPGGLAATVRVIVQIAAPDELEAEAQDRAVQLRWKAADVYPGSAVILPGGPCAGGS